MVTEIQQIPSFPGPRPTTPERHTKPNSLRLFVYPTNYRKDAPTQYGHDGKFDSPHRLDNLKVPPPQQSKYFSASGHVGACIKPAIPSTNHVEFQSYRRSVECPRLSHDMPVRAERPRLINDPKAKAIRKTTSSKSLGSPALPASYYFFPRPSHYRAKTSVRNHPKVLAEDLPPLPPIWFQTSSIDPAQSTFNQHLSVSQTTSNRPSTAYPTTQAVAPSEIPSHHRVSCAPESGRRRSIGSSRMQRARLKRYPEHESASEDINRKEKSKSWEMPGFLKLGGVGKRDGRAKYRSAPALSSVETESSISPLKSEFSEDSEPEEEIEKDKWVGKVVKKMRNGFHLPGGEKKNSADDMA